MMIYYRIESVCILNMQCNNTSWVMIYYRIERRKALELMC